MARLVRTFACTVPAGTPEATPVSIPCDTGPYRVNWVSYRVPPGPYGEVGFVIGNSGVPVLPDLSGQWIITNDDSERWDVVGQPDLGGWELIGYNTGSYDHTVYLTFGLSVNPQQSTGPVINPNIVGQTVA